MYRIVRVGKFWARAVVVLSIGRIADAVSATVEPRTCLRFVIKNLHFSGGYQTGKQRKATKLGNANDAILNGTHSISYGVFPC
jgi:hypothetical protein